MGSSDFRESVVDKDWKDSKVQKEAQDAAFHHFVEVF